MRFLIGFILLTQFIQVSLADPGLDKFLGKLLNGMCLKSSSPTYVEIPRIHRIADKISAKWGEGIRLHGSPWDILESIGQGAYARTVILDRNVSPYMQKLKNTLYSEQITLRVIEYRDLKTGKFIDFGGGPGLDLEKGELILPKSAFFSDEAMEMSIYHFLAEKMGGVPLDLRTLSPESREFANKMMETYGTSYVNEHKYGGVYFPGRNRIGLKKDSDAGVHIHEITHSSTDRKIAKGINPVLAGRAMWIRTRNRRPDPRIFSDVYATRYSADEVEARIRQMAYYKLKKAPVENIPANMATMVEAQLADLKVLRDAPKSEWVLEKDYLTHRKIQVEFEIPLPPKLRKKEKIKFLDELIKKRIAFLERYRLEQ